MLVQLTGEQISDYWKIVKYSIENSLPPIANETYDKMNHILENLLNGGMQCWVSYSETEEKRTLEAVMVTQILDDASSDVKSLLVYSLFAFGVLNEEVWNSGFNTISKWAMSKGCNRIVAYTDVDRVKQMVQHFGGEAKYTFVSLPLRSIIE